VRKRKTYYSAMSAYSRKNGWKLASVDADRNGGMVTGSLVGIWGRVLREVEEDDDGRDRDDDDGTSTAPGRDIANDDAL